MAGNACCSYRRFNSLPSSALTILDVMASEVPVSFGKVTRRPAACSQSREPCDDPHPLAKRMIMSLSGEVPPRAIVPRTHPDDTRGDL
jgi:hypothetical protein